jgi:hypothetical protein
MTKTGLEFGISVIVICLIFVICDLEFLFRQYCLPLTNLRSFQYISLHRSEEFPAFPLKLVEFVHIAIAERTIGHEAKIRLSNAMGSIDGRPKQFADHQEV